MPELPEVETIARDLRGLVTGSRIVGVRSNWPRTLRSHEPDGFASAVHGREIEAVGRRGKQLLVALGASASSEAPASSGASEQGPAGTDPAVLTIHLKMTGQLFVVDPTTPEDRHVHVAFTLGDGRELRFRDIRKFGRIGLYRRDPLTGQPAAGEAMGVLASGIEPLSDEFTPARLGELLAHRRGRLKTLLLNQDLIAGVGNIYADEALWRSRIHPLRDARTLRPAEVRLLNEALRDVLSEAVRRRGSSVDDYTAPEGDGSMQEHLAVYQRAGEPCLRCSRLIERIVVGGRSTHFCLRCQRPSVGASSQVGLSQAGPASAGNGRRGPRWTELSGDGVVGRTKDEETRVRRTAATREAAAARRAAARSGAASTAASGAASVAASGAASTAASGAFETQSHAPRTAHAGRVA
jgi:formamidopyrimidine-DNA glycosylase